MHLRRDLREYLTRPLVAAVAAAIVAGVLVGVAEALYQRSETRDARNDVSRVLDDANSLLATRQRAAANRAEAVAGLSAVQAAYASRDAAALDRFAKLHPDIGFVLWDGRSIGIPASSPIQVAVKVIGGEGQLGSVVATVAPDDPLLDQARRHQENVHVQYVLGDRVVAASPGSDLRSPFSPPKHKTVGQMSLGSSDRPARIYAYASPGGVPGGFVWAALAAVIAAALAVKRPPFRERRVKHANVRDAVAIVGETLAATHNANALLPVILEAATEATGAKGGAIVTRGVTRATRGVVTGEDRLEVPILVEEGVTSTLELYAPTGGFDAESREAAAWIARQGEIALENARLHSLVKQQAVTDELTGLANRRRFVAQLEAEVARAERSGTPLSVVLADIDDFKRVNDTWGHDTGDNVLRRVAVVLEAATRDVDLPVRLGGEEFAILLPETDTEGARHLAERVREAIAETVIDVGRDRVSVTASFGVSCFPETAEAAQLLVDADRGLYAAKRSGKNCVVASENTHH
jgi:diguanylate cyclase (GGDEF)-like protein